MNESQNIGELQKQIDAMKTDLLQYRQRIIELQEELDKLQGKKIAPPIPPRQHAGLENFIGLRLIHLVGIVVLVTGLSIGVKYAIDRELITESARIILAYAAGAILYVLSVWLKKKYHLFSAILFSGGMASFYFTTYAAFVYYGFFSFAAAFALMAAFTVFTAFESIRYNRQEIAILGMVGAYGIPFLISVNSDRADLFFSYIVFINLGIVFLAFRKKWKLMGQIALVISWMLFLSWAFLRYREENLETGVITLGILYFLFSMNAISDRVVRNERLDIADVQQVIVNNFIMYLGALVIFGYGNFGSNADTVSGLVAALILLEAAASYFLFSDETVFQKALAMQASLFIVVFIGLTWNGLVVTLAWTAFAVFLFAWGMYSRRSWPRLASILVMGITLAKLIIFDSAKFTTIQKIIAYLVIGTLLLILSFLYQKYKQRLFEK
jgi:uncharacterized membrane protein